MMNDAVHSYLKELISPKKEWVEKLERVDERNRVPIMESVAIDFMLKQIQIHKPKRILEVGTAIGYSASRMAEAGPDAEILTIERDETRYKEAKETIAKLQKDDRIKVIHGDALDVLERLKEENERFDFIFIDAAKGKYEQFFQLAHPLLNKGGWLVTDNVLFRNYVANIADTPKRYKNMVKKIDEYNRMLSEHPDYITSVLPIGDGVMISYKKD